MPIGGFVVTVDPDKVDRVKEMLLAISGAELHGQDEKGNLVLVLDAETSEEMELMTKEIRELPDVLALGLVYFHAEDEVERIEKGEYRPSRSFGRKPV